MKNPLGTDVFGALIGAWCLGASLGGWSGAAAVTVLAYIIISWADELL